MQTSQGPTRLPQSVFFYLSPWSTSERKEKIIIYFDKALLHPWPNCLKKKNKKISEIVLPWMEIERWCVATSESIINSALLVLIALAKKQRSQKTLFQFQGHLNGLWGSLFFFPVPPQGSAIVWPHAPSPPRYGCGPLNFLQSHFYPREKVNPCIMNHIMSPPLLRTHKRLRACIKLIR